MSDISFIGISSLLANQFALSIASQNIANANTENYSRRMVDFVENPFNQGVSISDVRRIVDETANEYARNSQSNFSQMDTYAQELQAFEPLFDDKTTSIGKYLADSLGSLEKLNSDALSTQDRGLYLSSLSGVANRFQNLSGEINRQLNNVNQTLLADVNQVNNLLSGIANINAEIAKFNTNKPIELFDKRDQLASDLAKLINFKTQIDSEGLMNITLSNGTGLVTNTQSHPLTTMIDPENSSNLILGMQQGSMTVPIASYIDSGSILGLINYRQNALEPSLRALGRLSLCIADSFNKQNKLGMVPNGDLGGNIFNDVNSTSAINNRVNRNLNNTGTGNFTVDINNLKLVTTSDYRFVVGAGNTYTITRKSDNSPVSSGTISGTPPQAISFDGITFNITGGTFSAGDEYTISPTQFAANNLALSSTDPNILALAWPVKASVGAQKQGSTGAIKVTDVTSTTTADFSLPKQLNPPLLISFVDATHYQIINANTLAVIEGSPTPLLYDPAVGKVLFPTAGSYDPGYRVTLTGSMQAGDTFNINYNTHPGDNDNGLKMAALYQLGILENGTQNFGQGYNSISSNISIETNKSITNRSTTEALNEQAQKKRDTISGVSLEEETMNLARYQQAYQASAQIIETAKTIFEAIISMARR